MTINSIDVAINGRFLEAKALAPILPGMILERYEDGVRPHSVTEGIAPPLIAIENGFTGTDIHTPYEMGDTVYIRYCLPGDVFWGVSAVIGDLNFFLASAGSLAPGYLKKIESPIAPIDGAVIGREISRFAFSQTVIFSKVEVL